MLYDPKWNETKADPLTLDSLIAWAEKQPAEKAYDFWCHKCYLGQYFEAHGLEVYQIGTGAVRFAGAADFIDLPPHFAAIAQTKPHTFGAALRRARAAFLKG